MSVSSDIISHLKTFWRAHGLNAATIISSLVTSCGQLSAHTFLLYKYKEIVHFYKLGEPIPLHESIENIWKETVKDLDVSPYILKKLDPFTVFGFDTFHAGFADSKFGAIIGIPINFTYRNVQSIKTKQLKINNDDVNWNRPDAQDLLKSLILSHEAKKFAIAREVIAVQRNYVLRESLSYPIFIFGTHYTYASLSKTLNLANKFILLRTAVFGSIACIATCLWKLQDNLFTYYNDKQDDEDLAQKGPEYIKGGMEYYDKILQRNIALRSLMGENGEKKFTDRGEFKLLFNFKKVQLSERKKFFAMQLQNEQQFA